MSNPPDNATHSQPAPTPPSAAPANKSKPSDAQVGDASLSQIIDTIEAIIIALIVALTFRAFVVEAFVIPTGSMAPTLLGAHSKVICPKCGYVFDIDSELSYQAVQAANMRVIPAAPDPRPELHANNGVPLDRSMNPVYCPNCRYAISPKELPQYLKTESDTPVFDGRKNDRAVLPFVWTNNGDRILVLKYLYSVLKPTRWDVIVFKEPKYTKDNYIKRLIGLPGDTVEIVNGNVYIGHGENGADRGKMQIARKPQDIQQALWQLVYDNDHYPVDAGQPRGSEFDPQHGTFADPWQGDANWIPGPVMAYNGAGPDHLAFNLTPMQALTSPYTLNTLGFNNDYYIPSTAPRSYVGDLRLETVWAPSDAAGASVSLTLGRPSNCYQVSWSPAGLKLARYNPTTAAFDVLPVTATTPMPQAGKAYHLALNNVDHAVQFSIDGTAILDYKEPWTAADAVADEARFPSLYDTNLNLPTGRPDTMIRIDVGGHCLLSHLKLFRDLYYTQYYVGGDNPPTGTEGHAITLHDGEYFAMGDNSRRSSDSRFWELTYDAAGDLGLRNGVVPQRYLLGKAFFVYWPAGYRPTDDVPFLKNWPLVPNMGEMRVIR